MTWWRAFVKVWPVIVAVFAADLAVAFIATRG